MKHTALIGQHTHDTHSTDRSAHMIHTALIGQHT